MSKIMEINERMNGANLPSHQMNAVEQIQQLNNINSRINNRAGNEKDRNLSQTGTGTSSQSPLIKTGTSNVTASNSTTGPVDSMNDNATMNPNFYPLHYQQAIAAAVTAASRGNGTCPICFSQIAPTNIVLDPCQHQFHVQCIEKWLQNEKNCPICRVAIQQHRPIVRNYPHPAPPYPSMHMNTASNPPVNAAPINHSHLMGFPHMNNMPVMNYSHFPSASVYDLPPEVFLDNPYDPLNGLNAAKLRKGKWTTEETAYCDRLITEFKNGNLPLAEGTTLRTFLSKLLNCDPMRISKKYTGTQCIGKIIFRRRIKEPSKDEIEVTRKQLAELERIYLERERSNQLRREKRLESELTRDRNRLLAARSLGFNVPLTSNNANPNATSLGMNLAGLHGHLTPLHQLTSSPYMIQPPNLITSIPNASASNSTPVNTVINNLNYAKTMNPLQPSVPESSNVPNQSNSLNQNNNAKNQTNTVPNNSHSRNSGEIAASSTRTRDTMKDQHPQAQLSQSNASALDNNRQYADNTLTTVVKQEQHIKTEDRNTSHSSMSKQSDHLPHISSVDSFASLFPRIASLDCFQSLPTSSFESNHSSSIGSKLNKIGSIGNSLDMLHSSPSIENLNVFFPRVNSLEQFSNFMANMSNNADHSNPSKNHVTYDAISTKYETSDNAFTASRAFLSSNGNGSSKISNQLNSVDNSNSNIGHSDPQTKDLTSRTTNDDNRKFLSPQSMTQLKASYGIANNLAVNSSTTNSFKTSSEFSSLSKIPRISSMDNFAKIPRISSTENFAKTPRISSTDKFPRVHSSENFATQLSSSTNQVDKLPRVPSLDKFPRIGSMDRLSRVPSLDRLPRVPSLDLLSRINSSDQLDRIPRTLSSDTLFNRVTSFSNFSGIMSSYGSSDKLNTLNSSTSTSTGILKSNGYEKQVNIPRNTSLEDILSLVASSENSNLNTLNRTNSQKSFSTGSKKRTLDMVEAVIDDE